MCVSRLDTKLWTPRTDAFHELDLEIQSARGEHGQIGRTVFIASLSSTFRNMLCHFVKILLYPVVRFSFTLVTRVVAMLETLLLMSQSWKMSVSEPFNNPAPGSHRKWYEELPTQVEVSSFPAHNEVVPAALERRCRVLWRCFSKAWLVHVTSSCVSSQTISTESWSKRAALEATISRRCLRAISNVSEKWLPFWIRGINRRIWRASGRSTSNLWHPWLRSRPLLPVC